jgi:hypothetical protein
MARPVTRTAEDTLVGVFLPLADIPPPTIASWNEEVPDRRPTEKTQANTRHKEVEWFLPFQSQVMA